MNTEHINLITIGYARQALVVGSREHKRMKLYADKIGSLHIIVFTKRKDEFKKNIQNGNLIVYPTNSVFRVLMLIDAFRIGLHILRHSSRESSVISSQDPFETSLVGRPLSFLTMAKHHVQLHGDNFSDTPWRSESFLNRIRYWFGLWILTTTPHIRVVSERIKRSLILKGVHESCIQVLPIRPELERFLLSPHEVGEHSPFVFLIASRFSSEKNIPLMIKTFAKSARIHTHARLRIIGKGTEETHITALVSLLNLKEKVDIIPWTEHIEKEMQTADVFLLASLHEAYGLTLVEALAVGLPLITTDVGCVGEVVKDGVHGIVFSVNDEDAFFRAMDRMITDLSFRKICSDRARMTAKVLASTTEDEYVEAWVATHTCNVDRV